MNIRIFSNGTLYLTFYRKSEIITLKIIKITQNTYDKIHNIGVQNSHWHRFSFSKYPLMYDAAPVPKCIFDHFCGRKMIVYWV